MLRVYQKKLTNFFSITQVCLAREVRLFLNKNLNGSGLHF